MYYQIINCISLLWIAFACYYCYYFILDVINRLINSITRFINCSIVIGYLWHDCYCLSVARILLSASCDATCIVGQLWYEFIVGQLWHESYWPASHPATQPCLIDWSNCIMQFSWFPRMKVLKWSRRVPKLLRID